MIVANVSGTQAEVAESIGWSTDKVKKYAALSKVTQKAWQLIVTEISCVTEKVTDVTFTEGILRPILKLTDSQQIDLMDGLICNRYREV